MKKKHVLIVVGHPYKKSFNAALAQRYAQGAKQAGHMVRLTFLGDLKFDPVLRIEGEKKLKLESDLQKAQQNVEWAQHMVFVFPYWWGSAPALLKGYFDKVFEAGFAFKFKKNSPLWEKLLVGKSARLIITMDGPKIWDAIMFGAAGTKIVKKAILEFCGVKPVWVTKIDRVRKLDVSQRDRWLREVEDLGKNSL